MKCSRGFLALLSVFSLLLLSACSSQETGMELYQHQSAEQIFTGADTSLLKDDYKDAIERYESLQLLYPESPYARQSSLNLLYAYYSDRQFELATASADRYIHLYPQGPDTDYVYYLKGLAIYNRHISYFDNYLPVNIAPRQTTALQEAFQTFNELVLRFPNSRYVPDAHQRMIFIRDVLARHDLEIAEYYFARKAYLAAARRANEIVINYQNAPQVKPALVLMIKSYRALGLTSLADQTMAVFTLNYPNTPL